MKSWIYQRTKDQLVQELDGLGIDSSGTLDDLRRRLSRYVSKNPEYAPKHTEMCSDDETETTIASAPEAAPAAASGPAPTDLSDSDPARAMNQIRKWGCHFDGRDPLAFLERVAELRQAYVVSPEQLLLGLPELLRGDSLLWYRNSRDTWTSWEDFDRDFRRTYLSRRYIAQMRREIQNRMQRADEPYRKFEAAILTMMRRTGTYTVEDKLDTLYENLYPEYKTRIRRDDVSSLNDLRDRADEYEAVEAERKAVRKAQEPTPTTVALTYNRADHCWRCKQRGHTRADCKRPARKFCSQCGKDGVLTRDCHPRPENSMRAGSEAANSRDPPASN